MSSHREAPEISKDPVADNADVYAFVSPDKPDMVTIISNFVPLQGPAGGPNFYEFGDDVLYSIYIDNDGDAKPEIEYQFQFTTTVVNPNTFLYNTGTIPPLGQPDPTGLWSVRQTYSVVRFDAGKPPKKAGPPPGPDTTPGPAFTKGPTSSMVLGGGLPCPPCNVGPNSTPDYETNYGHPAVQSLQTGEMVFCGQRNDPFYVDLGGVFDLGDLRPFQQYFAFGGTNAEGVDATKQLNIHSIAIQVPISMLTKDGSVPTNVTGPSSVLGIWSAASRRKARMFDDHKNSVVESGPWVQVSRLGNPLFNEVIVPLGEKDDWNRGNPVDDSEYLTNVQSPELANLIANVLYPTAFTKLAGYHKPRADLVAILLTGIPDGVLNAVLPPGSHYSTLTGTGTTYADMLRLNVAIPPTSAANASLFGIFGGDPAGFPNGRRVFDDVVAIELKAIAGAALPFVDTTFTADGAAGALTQWQIEPVKASPLSARYLDHFPYVGTPYDGFHTPVS